MSQIKLDFSGVKDYLSENSAPKKIRPSITECVIKNISAKENDNGKAYISMEVESVVGGLTHEERFFVTTGEAIKHTQARIGALLAEVTGKVPELKNVDIDVVKKALVGQKVRLRFDGEEYLYDGKVFVKTMLAFRDFAENVGITNDNTRLRAPYIKRLKTEATPEKAVAQAEPNKPTVTEVASDMAF